MDVPACIRWSMNIPDYNYPWMSSNCLLCYWPASSIGRPSPMLPSLSNNTTPNVLLLLTYPAAYQTPSPSSQHQSSPKHPVPDTGWHETAARIGRHIPRHRIAMIHECLCHGPGARLPSSPCTISLMLFDMWIIHPMCGFVIRFLCHVLAPLDPHSYLSAPCLFL
jgi:hypothetical protein